MNDFAIYNPLNKPVEDLHVIYGFNNGGEPGLYIGYLLAEDGTFLGNHICSHESFMYSDLGIYEGSRPDRHENFRLHYPDGYRMDFVIQNEVFNHIGLMKAWKLSIEKLYNNE